MVAAARIREVERTLDQLLDWCCRGALASSHGRTGVFRFVVDTPVGTRTRYVIATDQGCSTAHTIAHPPNATLSLSQENLTRLALGDLRGALAFATGRLQIEGDIFLAMNWIDQLGRSPL